jgi:moderate conductance mechanosensitive channel
MNLGRFFNSETLIPLILPACIGIVVITLILVLRGILYHNIHKLASKTKTCFDDIMIRDTRLASLLWCIWLGVFIGWKIAETPLGWIDNENKVFSSLFAALGIYTLVVIIMAFFKWYKTEICPRTSSGLDDIIMDTLITGTPVVGAALGTILILNICGKSSDSVNGWLIEHGPKIGVMTVVIVSLLLVSVLIIPRVIERAVRNSKTEQSEEEMQKRSDTLIGVVMATVQIAIIFMFVLMLLSELTINVTAILTGAGVVGLAVGFGAQSLVKDIISGLFIILENQYRKGDVIKIAGESGAVEEINLRRTVLRDMDGAYHVVPNGEIRVATNYTKQLSRVNLNISVSYDTDIDRAIQLINSVGKEMAEDPVWAGSIVGPPKALRIDNLGESSVDIKVAGETKPSRQWDVAGELRLRIKRSFDKEGIEIPFPHTKVIFGNQLPIAGSTGTNEQLGLSAKDPKSE